MRNEKITPLYERLSRDDDNFLPFRNIMNEYYARDTSRKIRSVFKSKGMSGKHMTGQVPYGYLWADGKREQWVIDEDAAPLCAVFSHSLWQDMDHFRCKAAYR